MFAEKLDFLMKLTGARNSVIGRAAHVDASTVSRLRAGKRELPRQQTFLPLMCAYFSRNITTAYQQRSAADAVCPGQAWPQGREQAERLLLLWLTEERTPDAVAVAGLMSNISRFSFAATESAQENELPLHREAGDECYIGNEGKREAVIRFLSAVAAEESPRTLLLYSDEPIDWLNEDATFARQWAALMRGVILRGNRIRIIHTIGRTLDEMLQALEKWLGVYMTGVVEPYYCPKLRDGIARRTLFIAPGLAAVCASSVGASTRDALNLYTSNAKAVQALEAEFACYFELCIPLMRIFTKSNMSVARELLDELSGAKGDAVVVQSAPSIATLPPETARQMQAQRGDASFMERYEASQRAFRKCLQEHCVYEAFPLADASALEAGRVAASVIGSAAEGALVYTKKAYAAHLAGVLRALGAHENYHVCLPQTPFLPNNVALFHKPRAGTIIARTDEPRVLFAINEERITAAFHEYVTRCMENVERPGYRKAVMERIAAAADALQR